MITLPGTGIVHCINCQHYVQETGACNVSFQAEDSDVMDWMVTGEGTTPADGPQFNNSARQERASGETGHCGPAAANFLAIDTSY